MGKKITKENAREYQAKSVESRKANARQAKLAKDIMAIYLNTPITDTEALNIDDIQSMKDINGKNLTVLAAGLAGLARRVADTSRDNGDDLKLALQIAGQWVDKSEQVIHDTSSEEYDDYVRQTIGLKAPDHE